MENKKLGVSLKAIVYNDHGKILLMRRSKTAPTRAGYWDLPGGILEMNEDPKEAIKREIKEEAGLDVSDLLIIDCAQWSEGERTWVTNCYQARSNTDEIVLSYEHDDFIWIHPEKLGDLKIFELHKKFIQTFKK